MTWKDILSIILGVVAIISFIIFINSATDIEQFTRAIFSCFITVVSIVILLIWNPWLIGN